MERSLRTLDPLSATASIAFHIPTISKAEAIAQAETTLGGKCVDVPTKIEYFVKDDAHLALTHVVQVQTEDGWYQASVDAHTNEVINVVNFVAEAAVCFLSSSSDFCDFNVPDVVPCIALQITRSLCARYRSCSSRRQSKWMESSWHDRL